MFFLFADNNIPNEKSGSEKLFHADNPDKVVFFRENIDDTSDLLPDQTHLSMFGLRIQYHNSDYKDKRRPALNQK